ncbi:hypothetical protein ACPXCX_48530, partial [Streptomyces sp. DT225]
MARTGRFGPAVFRREEHDVTYTTAQYLAVLRTYCGHRALPEAARRGLPESVAELVDGRCGGRVEKRHRIGPGSFAGGDRYPFTPAIPQPLRAASARTSPQLARRRTKASK